MEASSSRRVSNLDPVNDSLEQECDNFLQLVRQANVSQKAISFGIIKQLWLIRVRGGDDLPAPDVPAEVLAEVGFSLPSQVRWIGAIKKRLRDRRDGRYGR